MGYWINYQSARGTAPAEKRVDPAQVEAGYADLFGVEWRKYEDRNGEMTYSYMSLTTEDQAAGHFFGDSEVVSLMLPSGCDIDLDLASPPCTIRITVSSHGVDPTTIPLIAVYEDFNVNENYPTTLYDWAASGIVNGETYYDPDDSTQDDLTWVTFEINVDQRDTVHINDVSDERSMELHELVKDAIAPGWGCSDVYMEDYIVYEDGPYALTEADLPALEASGYTFNGWSIDGEYVSVGHTINSNVTLVAVWAAAGGGGGGKPDLDALVKGFICGLMGKGVL